MNLRTNIPALRTRLRAAREDAGISRREMAHRAALSETVLKEIEAGDVIPTDRSARLLEQIFGENIDRLLRHVPIAQKLPAIRPQGDQQ